MSDLTADGIKQRLDAIAVELQALSPDPAHVRDLAAEADSPRRALDEANKRDIDAARKHWAVRAGPKGSHTVDPRPATAAISSPTSMGG